MKEGGEMKGHGEEREGKEVEREQQMKGETRGRM